MDKTYLLVNWVPEEGQIIGSFTSESNLEALAFPTDYSTVRNHFDEDRQIPTTPSKYVHTRLKSCDDRLAANLQYIFHALDWIDCTRNFSSFCWKETISERN